MIYKYPKERKLLFKYLILYIIPIIIAFISCKCDNINYDNKNISKNKTVIVYMPWTGTSGNLKSFFDKNIEDIKEAIIKNNSIKETNVILFIAYSSNKAELIKINYEKQRCKEVLLKSFDDGAMNTVSKMRYLLNIIYQVSPTPLYSMIIGGHGVGWIQYNAKDITNYQKTNNKKQYKNFKYFGGQDIKMNIDELAFGISSSKIKKMQYILFDDCNMANIETAYELRFATNYLIASATEIMAYGMPYHEIWNELANISPNYQKIVDKFYQFYSNFEVDGTLYNYGTISVTDCSKTDIMIDILDEINRKHYIGTHVDDVQVLDGYEPAIFYDLSDYIHKLCKDDINLINKYNQIVKLFIPYEKHTQNYYSSLYYSGVHMIKYCSGLTISAMSENTMVKISKKYNSFYKRIAQKKVGYIHMRPTIYD